jgi:hypothetical protein
LKDAKDKLFYELNVQPIRLALILVPEIRKKFSLLKAVSPRKFIAAEELNND